MKHKISRRKFISDAGIVTGGITLAGTFGGKLLASESRFDNSDEIWWLGADPHVAYKASRIRTGYDNHLETCIDDVNRLGYADYAIILGDLGGVDLLKGLDRIQTADNASRFRDAMKQLKVNDWFYNTGNHEFHDKTRELVIPPQYWVKNVAGIRIINISDEKYGYGGGITDEQERWFMLELNRKANQPTIIFSHQPPDRSGSWNFWDKFKTRIKDYNIQAWFHGHEHKWSIEKDATYGFYRIGLGAIYEYTGHDRFPGGDEAHHNGSFLIFKKNETVTNVTVKFRHHGNRQWITADGYNEISFAVNL